MSRHLRTYGGLWLALVLVAALRLPAVAAPLWPDEGGMLLVAAHWREGGPGLYGSIFVDRPPLTIGFYLVAHLLGGAVPLRMMGIGLVWLSVLFAWRIGRRVGGVRAASLSALVVAALSSNPLLGAQAVNAELIGAPLLLGSIAALLAADRSRGMLIVSGVLAGSALLVKQNLGDAIAFGVVFVAAAGWLRVRQRRAALTALLAFLIGVALPWLATSAWVVLDGPGFSALWTATYGFRSEAARTLTTQSASAPLRRLGQLPARALAAGLVVVVAVGLFRLRRVRLRTPLVLATLALIAVELAGIALGGSYWSHYLLGLVPAAALLVAITAEQTRLSVLVRRRILVSTTAAVAVALTSALVANALVASPADPAARRDESAMIQWLSSAKRPHDTGLVTWGHPEVLQASGIKPANGLIWSLPQRTLDPKLKRFRQLLRSQRAPEWLIVWIPIDSWGLDPHGRALATMHRRYRAYGQVCKARIYIRRDVRRVTPPLPTRCAVRP